MNLVTKRGAMGRKRLLRAMLAFGIVFAMVLSSLPLFRIHYRPVDAWAEAALL